jgi:uncharacterized protein
MTLKEKYGQWALITGPSSGIGEEFARYLASKGLNLVLVARRKERLERLLNELKKENGIDIAIAPLDLKDEKFIDTLKGITNNKEIGILINNAGFGLNGEFVDLDVETEADMVKVNCIAPTILTHHFVKPMVQRRKGAIIFLGSVVACQPTPYMTTYAATKVFNAFMGDALWYELKKYNIDVLTLNPGGTETEFQRISNAATGPTPRTVKQVVNTAMNALGKKPSVIDGFLNKIMGTSSRFGSRKSVVSVSGWIAKKLYSKKNQSD